MKHSPGKTIPRVTTCVASSPQNNRTGPVTEPEQPVSLPDGRFMTPWTFFLIKKAATEIKTTSLDTETHKKALTMLTTMHTGSRKY